MSFTHGDIGDSWSNPYANAPSGENTIEYSFPDPSRISAASSVSDQRASNEKKFSRSLVVVEDQIQNRERTTDPPYRRQIRQPPDQLVDRHRAPPSVRTLVR